MFAELLLASTLALPLSPLPSIDRHAAMLDEVVAEGLVESLGTFEIAQYGPPAGGPPPSAGRAGGPAGPGAPGPMAMRGLGLTEAQQDAIFNLHHAQAPQMREQMKALRKARDALQELARSDNFDEQRASALAGDIARIGSTIALMRARTQAAVWKLLTPEQRQQAARMYEARAMRGPMGGPMGGMWDGPRAPR